MKKMKITALLLALIMLLQPVLVSADAAGVSLEDYMGFINNAQNYGLIDSAYEYYVQQLEGKTVAERYQTLKSWHEGLLGDLFYENFIAYYEKAHAGENLICVCGAPCEYGTIAHTNPACQWYFGNLPLTEQHDILSGLEGDTKAAYEAVLPADTLDKLNRYNVRTLTAAADDVSVQINVPTGAFAEDYILSANAVVVDDAMLTAIQALNGVDSDKIINGLAAFDISFANPQTEDKMQPAEGYPVGLTFNVPTELASTCDDLQIYHLTIDANNVITAETVGDTLLVDDEKESHVWTVEANSFSIYVVTGGTDQNLYNYKIMMSVGDTLEITSTNGNSGTWSFASGDTGAFSLSATQGRNTNLTARSAGTVTVQFRRNSTTETIEVVAVPAVGSYQNDIIFANIRKNISTSDDEYTNTYGPYTMKIRFEDTDGNLLNMGEDYYAFDSACDINVNTFAASAPEGMTYAGAFFYWTGHDGYDGAKVYVTSVIREDELAYGSYLWYAGTHDTSGQGSWAYQASGVLHVVYAPVTEVHSVIFKDHDNYELASYALKHNDSAGGIKFPSGYVANIDNMKNNLIETHHTALNTAWEFSDNWVVTGGGSGIDGTYTTAELKTAIVRWNIKSDITITAQCELMTGNLVISKTVEKAHETDVAEIPADAEFTFTVEFSDTASEFSYTKPDGTKATIKSGGTITLTAGQSVKIEGIKAGTTYTVTETPVAGFAAAAAQTGAITAGADATAAFVNVYQVLKTGSITINKTVVDATFTEGERTFTFTVKYSGSDQGKEQFAEWMKDYPDGVVTVTVGTSKTNSVTLSGLPIGSYTVEETPNAAYTTKADGEASYTATASITADALTDSVAFENTRIFMDITVTKVWNDNSNNLGKRPASVTLTVHASSEVQDQTVVLTAENAVDANTNTWSTTLTVPKFDANGNEITYTVNEANAPDFYNKTAQSGLEVTNSVNVGSLMISKKVIDEHRLYTDTVRTFSFKIKQGDAFIQENGADKVWTVAIDTLENNAEQTNRLTVAELQPGKYTVEELPYNGYVATKREVEVTVAAGHVVEAAFENTVKTVNIPVTKTWEDLNDKYKVRPARITVALTAKYADGTAADSKYNKSITIDATTDWKREFQNVAIYDANGGALTYAVTETLAANAEFYTIPEIAGVDPKDEKPQIAITNSIKLGSLTITKTVVDPSGKYADDLTFEFTVTGKHNYNEKHTVTVKKTDDYTGSVRIPQLLIGEYTVIETVPDNYDLTSVTVGDTAIENGGNVAITYDNAPQTTTVTFTNTVKTVDIPVTKIWVDESNKLDTRPESIDLTLTGKVGETAVVTKTQKLTAANAVSGNANQWEFTFEKLPVYTAAGDQITYTVDEALVNDYEKSINGYVITNTLLSTTLTITKEGCNETLDAGQSFLFRVTSTNGVDLMIAINGNGSETISDLLVGDVVTVTEIEGWSWRYTGAAQTITLVDGENAVKITNTRDNPYWLDGDCYAENVFKANTTDAEGQQ